VVKDRDHALVHKGGQYRHPVFVHFRIVPGLGFTRGLLEAKFRGVEPFYVTGVI
jgi:hypothetical protein